MSTPATVETTAETALEEATAALETGNTEEAAQALEEARAEIETAVEAIEEQLAPTQTQAELILRLDNLTERLLSLETALAALTVSREQVAQAEAEAEAEPEEVAEAVEEVRAVTPAAATRRKLKGFW